MLKLRFTTCCVTAVLVCGVSVLGSPASDPKSATEAAALVGDWHGDSICVVRPSACHDEDSLYHVSPIAEKPGYFSLKADKIVAGKPVTMGIVECHSQPEKKLLTCDFEQGSLEFSVDGGTLRGTMKLKDGTLWRRISLKKVR